MSRVNTTNILPDVLERIKQFRSEYPDGIVILWWATATGKTGLSVQIGKQLPVEIISSDSRQVYRGMDIGTDKIMPAQQEGIPHRWLDLVDPDESFTAGERKVYALLHCQQILQRNNIPLIVWGTGLYIDMLYRNYMMPDIAPQRERRATMMHHEEQQPWWLYQELMRLDPDEAQKHHAHSHRYLLRALEICHFTGKTKTEQSWEQPVPYPILLLWLRRDKESTNKLINARINQLVDQWLVTEVQWLLDAWYSHDCQAMQGIGYKEIIGYLHWEYWFDKAIEHLKRNTHHLAKKQRTRFRRYLTDARCNPKERVVYKTYMLE